MTFKIYDKENKQISTAMWGNLYYELSLLIYWEKNYKIYKIYE